MLELSLRFLTPFPQSLSHLRGTHWEGPCCWITPHQKPCRAGALSVAGCLRESSEYDAFYPVLGHLLGKITRDRIPVVEGLEVEPKEDQLKALGAAVASSGKVGLFHLVGITPEAATLEAAFQGRPPLEEVDITMDSLREARRELSTAEGEQLDMVVLGIGASVIGLVHLTEKD